jgi:hypothetical protein
MTWLQDAPLWLIGLAMIAVLVMAHEVGLIVGRRVEPPANDARIGYLVSASLALLGLMVAFTFSAAQDRFNSRQRMVAVEANALGTAYLRTQLTPPPHRDDLGREMLRYAEIRARFGAAGGPAAISANARETAAEQATLWQGVTAAVQLDPAATLNPPLVQAMNELFDDADMRRAIGDAFIPISILRMLAIYAAAVAAIVGFAGAPARRMRLISVSVLALLALSYCLILDLDRPSSGTVRVSQAPMERAVAAIRQSEARKSADVVQRTP